MLKLLIFVLNTIQMILCQESLTLILAEYWKYYQQAFKCSLSQKAIKGAPLQILEIGQDQFYWIGLSPADLYKKYPQQSHVVLEFNHVTDQSRFAELLATSLKNQPFKTIWIEVMDSAIRDCGELKDHFRILSEILVKGQNIGILTGQKEWQMLFGKEGCPEIPKIAPLFFTSQQHEFSPFGGWNKAQYIFGEAVQIPDCMIEEYRTVAVYSAKQ